MSRKRSVLGLAAAILLAQFGYSVAQQDQTERAGASNRAAEQRDNDSTEATKSTEQNKKERPRLKIFELKNINPSEFGQLLSYQASAAAQASANAQASAAAHAHDAGAGASGFPAAPAPQAIHVAFDDEKNLLFVRGSSEQVAHVEKLVKALDVATDKLEKQSFGAMHLLPLRNSEAGQIQSLLAQLGINTHAVQLGKASVIVLHESEKDEIEQIEEVIAKLDRKNERDSERNAETKTAAETTTGEDRERR